MKRAIIAVFAAAILPVAIVGCSSSTNGSNGSATHAQSSPQDLFGCNGTNQYSFCSSSAPAAAAGGGGGVPVTRADAGPAPEPGFECHDSFYPSYPGFALTKDSSGVVRVKLSVSIYCDTLQQVPLSQNTYLAIYWGSNMSTPVRQVTYTELPGVGIVAPTRYTLSVVCVSGSYTGKYKLYNITASDGRTIPPYPLTGAIASSYTTDCRMK